MFTILYLKVFNYKRKKNINFNALKTFFLSVNNVLKTQPTTFRAYFFFYNAIEKWLIDIAPRDGFKVPGSNSSVDKKKTKKQKNKKKVKLKKIVERKSKILGNAWAN